MTAAHKELMLRYIKQCSGRVEFNGDCDICWVERPNVNLTLESYIDDGEGGITTMLPNLCLAHAMELDVVW
ncbi:hypothetical protein LCGC14_0849920 [marine sediment metagenome]|uniref:Uncharacterized protein n=1 Tax=marine sediment metagenome TaxID=412755 RepID=A0A0F9PVV7_9ZZZZ